MTIVNSSHTVANIAEAFYQWKQDLVAQGWSVAASGDGLSAYGAASDVISSGGSGANGFENDSAWMRLHSPSGDHEILIQMNVAAAEVFYGLFTVGADLFTEGSPSATVIPSATLPNAFSAGFFPEGSSMPGGPYDMTVGVDDAAPYGAYMTLSQGGTPVFGLTWDPTSSTIAQMAMLDPAPRALVVGAGDAFTNGWTDSIVARIGVAGGGGGPTDTTAPTVEDFTPATDSSIARADSIAVTVRDETELATVHIWGELADGSQVVVYDGTAFVGAFLASSDLTGETYTIVHDSPGWATDTLTLHVQAVDTSGNKTTASASYTITDAPAPSTPDTTAPTVALVSPADGSALARTDPIVVDVTDDAGLAAVFVWVVYPNGSTDVVHDSVDFSSAFAGASKRESISGGYRYTLRRAGGWPYAPTVRVLPIDTSGNTP